MNLAYIALVSAAGLFLAMIAFFDLGRRIGKVRLSRDPDGAGKGAGPAEAAIFSLMGLLIAFTFSGAASRFEARRHLITEEANAIETAYLRVDLLPASSQPEIRKLFGQYLDVRINTYHDKGDEAATQAKLSEAKALQSQIWTAAVNASQQDASGNAARILLPALNSMIDIATTRVAATETHPPRLIFQLLAGLAILSASLIGYATCANRMRNWVSELVLATTMALIFYVILDLEYPRQGLIRIDGADHLLIELKEKVG